jgi:POT family proton-dependent oligopeptide transporter
MTEPTLTTELEEVPRGDASGFGGHPKGLGPLFFTELWERFSYYGMRSILVLYMVAPVAGGGLAFDTKHAASIYGTYTMSVYLTALPGGLIADHFLGARIFHGMNAFYLGMVLIAIGTGFLKPNISAMVGGLYRENDPRRDSGFSIFYMSINIGALLAALAVGYLAQGESFKGFMSRMGFDPTTSWHWGFGLAGVGMTLGLIVYLFYSKRLAHVGKRVKKTSNALLAHGRDAPATKLSVADWKRVAAIFVFFLFTILFWAAYEQKGASLNLFAKDLVRTEVFGVRFPSSFMQSLTPLFVIILAPIFSMVWLRLRERQPSSPVKFTLGLLFIGMAYLLMIPASYLTASGRISPLWLVALYFLEVVGEMCLSPVGLSTVTKLSPLKLVGIMMGVWFLASSFGSKLAGYLSGFFVANNPAVLMKLYGGIAVGLLVSAVILTLLTPKIKKLMGTVK